MYFARVALVCLLVAFALGQSPNTNAYSLSNGGTCQNFELGSCTPCGGHYYMCVADINQVDCTAYTDSACTLYYTYVYVDGYCDTSSTCQVSAQPKYQFEATATSGISVFSGNNYGLVSLDATTVTVATFELGAFVFTSAAATDYVHFIQGIYDDGTYLTNTGFCAVDAWCTGSNDLMYRLSPWAASNSTLPMDKASISDVEDFIEVKLDVFTALTMDSTTPVEMIWENGDMLMNKANLGALSANFWPTGIIWDNFQLKALEGTDELIFNVDVGDFDLYRVVECDDYGAIQNCHVDAAFSLDGIISNPLIHPFFSFSYFFDFIVEDVAEDKAWDEQPAFELFE